MTPGETTLYVAERMADITSGDPDSLYPRLVGLLTGLATGECPESDAAVAAAVRAVAGRLELARP